MRKLNVRLTDEQLVFRDQVERDCKVRLTGLETLIVQKLVQCRGHSVSQDALAEAVWPDNDGWEDKTLFEDRIKVHICHIRRKFGEMADILTIWGQGYAMKRIGSLDRPFNERK